jgi:hypothetical protein
MGKKMKIEGDKARSQAAMDQALRAIAKAASGIEEAKALAIAGKWDDAADVLGQVGQFASAASGYARGAAMLKGGAS